MGEYTNDRTEEKRFEVAKKIGDAVEKIRTNSDITKLTVITNNTPELGFNWIKKRQTIDSIKT